MNKKTILLLLLIVGLVILGFRFVNVFAPKTSLVNPKSEVSETAKKVVPSETFIEYADPAGFSFNYPDNLSINAKEIEDNSTYADLQLSSKEISGSLSLKITDSKYKTLEEYLKANKISQTPKETKLGSMKALEVQTEDRLMLLALDQGILFTVEVPKLEEEFWMKVYNKVLADFSFVAPAVATTGGSSSDISFEGEEVVE